MQTYQILDKPARIRCLLCQYVSPEPEDVLRRYCPRCQRLHVRVRDDVQEALECTVRRARPDLPPQVRREIVDLMLDMLDPTTVYPPAAPLDKTQPKVPTA